MTEDDKALVAAMKDQTESWEFEDPREDWWIWQHEYAQAADRIEALSAEKQAARMEERAAIIAWLEKESTLCDCAAIYDGECVCGALDECKTVPIERILLAIEAGEHLK